MCSLTGEVNDPDAPGSWGGGRSQGGREADEAQIGDEAWGDDDWDDDHEANPCQCRRPTAVECCGDCGILRRPFGFEGRGHFCRPCLTDHDDPPPGGECRLWGKPKAISGV